MIYFYVCFYAYLRFFLRCQAAWIRDYNNVDSIRIGRIRIGSSQEPTKQNWVIESAGHVELN